MNLTVWTSVCVCMWATECLLFVVMFYVILTNAGVSQQIVVSYFVRKHYKLQLFVTAVADLLVWSFGPFVFFVVFSSVQLNQFEIVMISQ